MSSRSLVVFAGSRGLGSSSLSLVSPVVRAGLRAGFGVSVGCSSGAAALVLSAFFALGSLPSALSVFTVGGASGVGLLLLSSVPPPRLARVSSGTRVVLSRFRSRAGCALALALVRALLGLCLPPVVLPVLSPLLRAALPPRMGTGLPPVWRCALVCRLASFRLLVRCRVFRLWAGPGSPPVLAFSRGITVVVCVGFPVGPACLGALMPGWVMLAAAHPGFCWLAPICYRPSCRLRSLRLACKQYSYQDRTFTG